MGCLYTPCVACTAREWYIVISSILAIFFLFLAFGMIYLYIQELRLKKARERHIKIKNRLRKAHYTLCQKYGCAVFGVIDCDSGGMITYKVRYFTNDVAYEHVADELISAYIKAHSIYIRHSSDIHYVDENTYHRILRYLNQVA